jgi:hypothetical protein
MGLEVGVGAKRRLRHPAPGTVLGGLALIVALSGVAVAAIPGADGAIHGCYANTKGALRIVDVEAGQHCTTGETAISWKTGSNAAGGDLTGSYPNPQLAAGSVGSPEIADQQVKTADIGAAAITTNRLGPSSVTSAKVLDDSLTGNDILESSLGTVPSADTLDGVDSTGFLQGRGTYSSNEQTYSHGTGAVLATVPGGQIVAVCNVGADQHPVLYNRQASADMQVQRDDGGADPVTTTLAPSAADAPPYKAGDRVIWHGWSTAGRFTAIVFNMPDPGGDGCHFSADVIAG